MLLKAGQQVTVGPLHGPARRAARDERRAEADDHRRTSASSTTARSIGRWSRRSGSSPSTRRSRRPKWRSAARLARTSTSCSPVRRRDADRDLRGHDQSAGELDLVRLRGDGARHRPRAAAGDARSRSPARRCRPARRRRSLLLLLVLLPWPARAQHVENPQAVIVVPKSQLAQAARRGDHLHVRHAAAGSGLASARARTAAAMREEVAKTGRGREDPRAGLRRPHRRVRRARTPLASPIDKGFNRLAWLFPYLVGATGAAQRRGRRVPLVAPRRRAGAPDTPAADAADDPALRGEAGR